MSRFFEVTSLYVTGRLVLPRRPPMVGRHRVVLFLLPLSLLPAACWVPVDQTSSDAGPDAGGSGGGGAAGTNGWGAPKGQGGYPTLCTLGEPAPVVRTRAPEATGGCVETPSAMPGIRDGLGAATAPGGRIYLVGGWGDYNGGCETLGADGLRPRPGPLSGADVGPHALARGSDGGVRRRQAARVRGRHLDLRPRKRELGEGRAGARGRRVLEGGRHGSRRPGLRLRRVDQR